MPISEDLPPGTPDVVLEYFFALECPWLGWFEPEPARGNSAASHPRAA